MIDHWRPIVFIRPDFAESKLLAVSIGDGVLEFFDSTSVENLKQVDVSLRPQALAFTPSGDKLLVACDPPGRDDRPICIIDLKTGAVIRRLIAGSSNLRGIAVDPNGRYALATHLIPKADLPATQIAQGWVFTNAISFVPLDEAEPIVTLPLDLRTQGFANPEGIAISPNGARAYVAHGGADVVSVIDLPSFLAITARVKSSSSPVRPDRPLNFRSEDLSLPKKYVRARVPVGANPREIGINPADSTVVVQNQLDQSISVIDPVSMDVSTITSVSARDGLAAYDFRTDVAAGAKLFYSGKLSFSGQFSCASCHPDGHTDGLNWDLPADGFNNFHNTKSLLGAAGTAPYGWNGKSESLRSRFVGTLRSLFQYDPSDEEVAALEAYLDQLDYPSRLPHQADPKAPATERGRALFKGVARCHDCHSGPRLADGVSHDVGTGGKDSLEFDTPSLIRVSETAPFLHDGRAESLESIFGKHNPQQQHGNAAALDAEQRADLIEYLKSL